MTTRASRVIGWGLGVVLLLLAGQCVGFYLPGEDIAFLLIVGWPTYLARVLPQVEVKWDAVASTAVFSGVLIAGSHFFLRWLFREMSGPNEPRRWRWSWTAAGFAIVVLMFTAGMAAIGIAHQTAWLVASKAPLYHFAGLEGRVDCASNLRQIGVAIAQFADKHQGKLPDDFSELLREEDLTANVFVCPSSPDQPAAGQTKAEQADHRLEPGACSYIYLGKGLKMPIDPARIIALEPPEDHDGKGMNILYGDEHVEFIVQPEAESLLLSLGLKRVKVPAGGS